VKEVNSLLQAGGPANIMFEKVIQQLLEASMAVKLTLVPDQLAPHPKNRGGRMVVASSMEQKGALIVEQGAKLDLIGLSVAFEFPEAGPLKDQYMEKLQQLVAGSGGRLAPLTGNEIGLTVASTNLASFCRCSISGTKTDNKKLDNFDGHVQAPESFKGDFFSMCRKGWTWILI
jgi:hypothetical protein